MGAVAIFLGFGGILYHNYNKEPSKTVLKILRPLHYGAGLVSGFRFGS